MEVTIRKCLCSDVEQVYSLICELENCKFDFDKFKKRCYGKISDDRNLLLVAQSQQGVIVGFVSLTIGYQLHHSDKIATIEELIVDSKYRGKNIGTMLIKKTTEYSRKGGCEAIELTSNFSRNFSHKFYEKNGFNKTSYKFCLRLE